MTTYDIALIGFGGVNRTLAELIATRGEALRSDLGFACGSLPSPTFASDRWSSPRALTFPWP